MVMLCKRLTTLRAFVSVLEFSSFLWIVTRRSGHVNITDKWPDTHFFCYLFWMHFLNMVFRRLQCHEPRSIKESR